MPLSQKIAVLKTLTAVAYDPVEVAKILGLPEHVRPVGLITIGYPAEPPRKPHNKKIRLQKLVHRDKWDRTYA